jgi:ribosomal protein L11 methyltransferase
VAPIAFELTVPADREEDVVALLWEAGTTGLEVRTDASAGAYITVVAYFGEPVTEAALRATLAPVKGATVRSCAVPDVDWVGRFREGFQGFDAGGFRIAPAWTPESGTSAGLRLVVDPGRAFGTGTHESTRLCLEAVRTACTAATSRVLDVGTGSGILAVAAALCGARCVIGADLDPEALASARRHAVLNAVQVRLVQADGGRPFAARAFGLVLANLSAGLLMERRDELRALPAAGGTLVLAGFLETEAELVRQAYGGRPEELRRAGEWAALVHRSLES